MKWEEYQKIVISTDNEARELTEIECPKCGFPLWRRTDVVLTTYPPKFRYECSECDWSGTGY